MAICHSEFFWIKVKWFSEFHFTAKFWVFKLKMPFRLLGVQKKVPRHFFLLPFWSCWKNHPCCYFVKLFCSKAFTIFLPVCKKHTRDAEIRPFCPEFCLKSLSFLSFSEKCKNQGSFCKCLIINKNAILHLTGHGEVTKTLTIFQVWQNPVKFFHQNASQRLFRCFLPLTRPLLQPPRDIP